MGSYQVSSEAVTDHLCQVITPVGMLGYGFRDAEVIAALDRMSILPAPSALILDSGSTDSGPGKLALGYMSCPRSSYVRDVGKLIKIARHFHVPILISSAGGDGTDEHVDTILDIIRELAEEPENSSWNFRVLAIYAGVRHELVSERLDSESIVGCGPSIPLLTQQDIEQTPRIVAQMGPEPFLDAMLASPDFDIVIGGRSYDPAPYIAWCAFNALKEAGGTIHELGEDVLGSFTHMGKILECGGACAVPKSNGAEATIWRNATFDVAPLDFQAKCLPRSVAAHALYEKSRPDVLHGPGGYLDLNNTTYEQLGDCRSVRVRNSTFKTSQTQGIPYAVKLEGGKVVGYRTVFVGSFSDPILIGQLDNLFVRIREYVISQHKHIAEKWDLGFHVYGLNEASVPIPSGGSFTSVPGVFVVGEALAESQVVASSIASTARIGCIHGSYKGQKATAGNLGFGHGGKFEMEMSECTEFSIYHLMTLEDGEEKAIHVPSHQAGKLHTDTSKGLFHWTDTKIGKGEISMSNDEGTLDMTTNGEANGHEKPTAIPSDSPVSRPRVLSDVAAVVRSKNAGPYEITVDVMFDDPEVYQLVKSSNLLGQATIAKLYDISVEEMVWCGFYDAALAFKATFPRKRDGKAVPGGGFMENDIHGSQKHTELLTLELDKEFVKQLPSSAKSSL